MKKKLVQINNKRTKSMALDFYFLLACCSYHGISFLLLEMTGKRMKSIKCELRKHMVGGSNSVVGAS